MESNPHDVQEQLQELNDLELAILVALVAEEHCLFSSDESSLALQNEINAICQHTYGLHAAAIQCTSRTTVDDLNEAILIAVEDVFENPSEAFETSGRPSLRSRFPSSRRSGSPGRFGGYSHALDDRRIADVVVLSDLDQADANVQVQVLEMLRTKRIFTRTSMHLAPKDFLVVGIMSRPGARLSHHLNDCFAMSHFHGPADGLPFSDGQGFRSAVPILPPQSIKDLRSRMEQVKLTAEVAAYLHNIVLFMRMSRYINNGVTATATKQLRTLSKALAPLHDLEFVPPSLVVLAARKIYAHRVVLATPETERSLQWGSSREAICRLLDGVTVEDAIEEVLASVEAPL